MKRRVLLSEKNSRRSAVCEGTHTGVFSVALPGPFPLFSLCVANHKKKGFLLEILEKDKLLRTHLVTKMWMRALAMG